MSDERYRIKLESVFEGPMDLLVFLIRKNEVDIYDIPIASITEQYLEYLNLMQALNIDLAGDFIWMAATLTHIKSRMLLPVHDDESEEEMEDPRMELTRPILEYLRMKSVAEELEKRSFLGEDIFLRNPSGEEFTGFLPDENIRVDLGELIRAFRRILDNMPAEHRVDMTEEKISIKERINQIISVLEEKGSVVFSELFSGKAPKYEMIITFLAILEMGKLNLVRITQNEQTGIIRLFYQ